MSFYPPKINERFARPKNIAAAPDRAEPNGTGASPICGAFVRFFLRVGGDSKTIEAVGFKSDGCGFTIAAADVLADILIDRRLTDLHGASADFWRAEIENELGEFPFSRCHCLDICVEALRAALADYRARSLDEFSGEKALVCTCFGVSEETVERVIAEHQSETVEDVTDVCKAGGGCGSCGFLIQEMIDVYQNDKY